MEEFFAKLKRKGVWATNDRNITMVFREDKGTPFVDVNDYRTKSYEKYSYLIVPTMLANVFAFETPTGRFAIAVMDDEAIFLSPNGVYLFPYHKTGKSTHEIIVTPIIKSTETDE